MKLEDRQRLLKIDEQIQRIKKASQELKKLSEGIQAIDCNVDRILASTKMLEINFSDMIGLV
ncbi:MAG: hypothetical protein HY787_08850 [Deltaproteobacteria bacterium]|nr:hypothetical protein [Deltaproteobacteria bacterium]